MSAFDKRQVQSPDFYDKRKMEFAVGDSVRVRDGMTQVFGTIIILVIAPTTIIGTYSLKSADTMDVTLASVRQHGPDGEFANGLSGLGWSVSSRKQDSETRQDDRQDRPEVRLGD